MVKKYKLEFLLLVVIVGGILRFWMLGGLPPAFHRDEAFLGYNAYSILKTGKDMTGDFLPLHLRSFLYSPAGYSYFAIPSIALVGLTEFSTRFPAALFGTLTIIAIYLLCKELFRKSPYQDQIALLCSFVLAIFPWHITLSRVATENVIVTFFLVVGTWLYLLWVRKEKWYLFFVSFFSFFITLGIYQAPRAFLPLFLPLLFIVYAKELGKKRLLISCLVFTITIVAPVIMILLSPQLSLRITSLSITQNADTALVLGEQAHQEAGNVPILATRIFHNKGIFYTSEFLQNYFAHFSYDFLFTDQGLPDRYRVPLMGLLYVWELPFILLGIVMMYQKQKKQTLLLLGWMLLAPVGSALTTDDVPNLQRTLFMVIPLSMFIGCGVASCFAGIKRYPMARWVAGAVIGIFCLYGLAFYILQYVVHEPLYRPWYRNDGYKQLVASVNSLLPHYQKAVITNRESAPAIFFLFYSQYNPAVFQRETLHTAMHDFDRVNFGKYEFSQDECPVGVQSLPDGAKVVTGISGILYGDSGLCKSILSEAQNLSSNIKILKEIRRHDNSPAFELVASH